MHAVLTGDIVNSTQLSPAEKASLIQELKDNLAPDLYDFYRGDSFQVYINDAAKALEKCLTLRLIAKSAGNSKLDIDVRLSIGLGSVEEPVKRLGEANGEAFVLSGRSFELLKTEKRLAITAADLHASITFEVIADFLDHIFKSITFKQARVLKTLLQGNTQAQAAKLLDKAQATIAQQVKTAGWNDIQSLLKKYEYCIQKIDK